MPPGLHRSASLGGRPYLGPSPRAPMTRAILAKLHREGFGEGRGALYHPWIRVRRAASSPIGTQHIFHLPGLGRAVHLLSMLERNAAALASYLGVVEVREQMPVHPNPRRHPGFDPTYRLSTLDSDRKVPGLLEIAEEARIDPGRYPGTNLHFVLTTDLLLTVRDGAELRLVYWPVKPAGELSGAGSERRLQRLELERRVASCANAGFTLITDKTVSKAFIYNLLGHKPIEQDLLRLQQTESLLRFAEAFNASKGATLKAAREYAGSIAGIATLDGQCRAFDVAVWLGHLDVHLSKPLAPHLPVQWGGFEQRKALRRALLGVAA